MVSDHGQEAWDFFICHASEDKDSFVSLLAASLNDLKYLVWFDEFSLRVGDSLRAKIDEGLARSRFGIVVLSPNFFAKKWPRDELDGLFSKESAGSKVILPVWLDIDFDGVKTHSPMLAGRRAALASVGVPEVVRQLRVAIGDLGMESKLVTGFAGYKDGGDHDASANTIMCHRCLNWFTNGQARCPACGWVVSEE